MGDLTRADLWYDLPEAAIAQRPVEPRDAARLLDARDLRDHRFADLPTLLAPGDLVVVNRTRVRAARLTGARQGTGGVVEVLVLAPVGDDTWEALLRPARRLRPGVVVEFAGGVTAEVVSDPVEGRARVRFRLHGDIDPEAWFEQAGSVPLPPYITEELEDPERYQTIFARTVGSAAAPTAALHFTPDVVESLGERGVAMTEVELEVGLGTFRPVATERVADHVMHAERFVVPTEAAGAVAACRERGGRVVAVGTTVLRTLEATAAGAGTVEPGAGSTDLFIVPGVRFRVADLLITNFHVPGSTLVALVAAVVGDRWREVYRTALDRGYRFLSFGDAMLAEVPRAD